MKSAIIAHFLRVFSRLFSPYFFRRSALKQVKRPGPALNGIEPEYTRPHVDLLWYHRQLLAHTSAFQNTVCRIVCLPRTPRLLPSDPTAFRISRFYGWPPYIALEKG